MLAPLVELITLSPDAAESRLPNWDHSPPAYPLSAPGFESIETMNDDCRSGKKTRYDGVTCHARHKARIGRENPGPFDVIQKGFLCPVPGRRRSPTVQYAWLQ